MPVLTLAQATELVVATLTRCRTEPGNARSVARALVAAEAEGLKGHGLSRLPTYAAQAKVGKVDGFAKPTLAWRRPAVAAVDADQRLCLSGARHGGCGAAASCAAERHRRRGDPALASLRRRRSSGRAAGGGGAGRA